MEASTSIPKAKDALRRRIAKLLGQLSADSRAKLSAQACDRMTGQPHWQRAHSLLLYAPMAGELDIWPLVTKALAAGKEVALPRFDSKSRQYSAARIRDLTRDLKVGQFGIREPADGCEKVGLSAFDLVLVPGVAFDVWGCRLGRGKGYYDRILSEARGLTCGVAFEEQMATEIPIEAHDRRVNCVLTPARWIETQRENENSGGKT